MKRRTSQQHTRRAVLADAATGRGRDEDSLDLLLGSPLRPVESCPHCRVWVEQGLVHICPNRPVEGVR